MDITYLGHSSFRIKGKNATVIMGGDGKMSVADRGGEDPYSIGGAGEYEIKGVGVIGITTAGTIIYHVEVDGVTVVHLGTLDHALTGAAVDALDGVDILMVPVSSVAISVISEIEPSIVIPMQHDPDQLRAFLKEIGKEDVAAQPKFSVTKDKIPEQMQVVVLS
jgi:L-ascorbate metabolism protein UlaG (beta-lactamase superfamily)